MSACVQSVAMFGAELWWKGGNVRGTTGGGEELQLLVNREARATTGAFWTTNLGVLLMESGLRPATNQLENHQRRFGLRLLGLPQGEKAREMVSSNTPLGKRLSSALSYTWTETERTVLLEEPESFDAGLIQEEREEAKKEAEKERPGLIMFTDGSWQENEAAGYAVAWKSGQTWEGIKTHMGFNQEAYDAECAALARALKTAAEMAPTPSHVTIFTDAQAAIRRMSTEELGPGQKYAVEARQHIATLRRAAPDITIEIRWCPAHEGVDGNEKADEWTKLQLMSQILKAWKAGPTRTSRRRQSSPYPLPTSGGRSRRRSGWRLDSGPEAGPPKTSTRCRKARGRMARLLGAPRGLPQSSTS